MPSFSKVSKAKLATCHPELQLLFNEVIKTHDCTITQGFRGKFDQDLAFEHGFSKLRWPKSKHNRTPAMAADVIPWPVDYNDRPRFIEFAKFVLVTAKQLKGNGKMKFDVIWGGDFNNNGNLSDDTFCDYPHYQLGK